MLADIQNKRDTPKAGQRRRPTRVLLADDHPLYRRGMRMLLTTFPDLEVCGEASTGEEAVQLAELLHPDVVIMDLQMPFLDGIEATRRIMGRRPATGILVTTMFHDDYSIRAAILAGARGYVLKDADDQEILRAVRAVTSGEAIFGTAVQRLLPELCASRNSPVAKDRRDQKRDESAPKHNPGPMPADENLTFLIADVRGYTRFTLQRGDEAAARLVRRFAELTESVVSAREGRVIELRGDEAVVTFKSASQAVRAALDLQRVFAHETDRNPDLPLAVGIGMDAGNPVPVAGGYRGTVLNLAARLCSRAASGEVLASDTVVSLAGRIDGVSCSSRQRMELKGFDDPVTVVRVVQSSEEWRSCKWHLWQIGDESSASLPSLAAH